MMESFQKQPRIKGLPSFSIYRNLRLKETDLNEITNTFRKKSEDHGRHGPYEGSLEPSC